MAREKTSELISACDSIFKQKGLLRLASPSERVPGSAGIASSAPASDATPVSSTARRLGVEALDALLPDGGLPTGKVIELSMRGGAAFGTQIALWACRAAQQQAALTGAESWCAFIDPSTSLHAPGVKATGVELQRLLVARPALHDMERVAVRLSEARVFSVIVLDLVGVPWAQNMTGTRSRQVPHVQARSKAMPRQSMTGQEQRRSQNWPRTVRQLALKLANTQAQVLLLTDSEVHQQTPLPVALRLQLNSEVNGLELTVLKDTQGRVGQRGVIPWSEWWDNSMSTTASRGRYRNSGMVRAKALQLQPFGEVSGRQAGESSEQQAESPRRARQSELPVGASSRLARTSRASL